MSTYYEDYLKEWLPKWTKGELTFLGLSEERAEELAYYDRAIRCFIEGKDDWQTLLSVVMHISQRRSYGLELPQELIDELVSRLRTLVYRTELEPPQISEIVSDRQGRYFHSRLALALLIEDSDPEGAIPLLEPLKNFFPIVYPEHVTSRDIQHQYGVFASLLKKIYASVGYFRSALDVHLGRFGYSRPNIRVAHSNLPGGFEEASLYLRGWLEQTIAGTSTVAEWKDLLSTCLLIHDRCGGVDEEVRDDLSKCPVDTAQFWAWEFGRMCGLLIRQKAHIAEALLEEVEAGDWDAGWLFASLMVDHRQGVDWNLRRNQLLRLYNASDIAVAGSRPYGARLC